MDFTTNNKANDTPKERPPLVIIAGPTASGKSATGIALAKRLNGEIISADSMQVYRGMDIGSAKVTTQEMDGVPHYLIDLCDPTEEWNVVRFQNEANAALKEIYSHGKLPIVVGGTGFYIQALRDQIDFTASKKEDSYREELAALAAKDGPQALYEKLLQEDPAAAAAIHPNNVKRVIRALEFHHETGSLISEHNETERKKKSAFRDCYFVLYRERSLLYDGIDKRVDQMISDGLVEEVQKLKAQGLQRTDVSMQGLGYKEILDVLEGRSTLDDAITLIKRDTRHFAKRQLTWFKREEDCIWVDRDAQNYEEMLAQMEARIRENVLER